MEALHSKKAFARLELSFQRLCELLYRCFGFLVGLMMSSLGSMEMLFYLRRDATGFAFLFWIALERRFGIGPEIGMI